MPFGGKPKVLPEMATQTLLRLSTVMDVIVSRPAANTLTLYPASTLILLGSGVTGVRLAHVPAGPPGSATALVCAKAGTARVPSANAPINANTNFFIFVSSTDDLLSSNYCFYLSFLLIVFPPTVLQLTVIDSNQLYNRSIAILRENGRCADSKGSVKIRKSGCVPRCFGFAHRLVVSPRPAWSRFFPYRRRLS